MIKLDVAVKTRWEERRQFQVDAREAQSYAAWSEARASPFTLMAAGRAAGDSRHSDRRVCADIDKVHLVANVYAQLRQAADSTSLHWQEGNQDKKFLLFILAPGA